MKHTTKILLTLALVATAALSAPGPSHAGNAARPPELRAGAVDGPTQESWWGAVAGYGCRQGFRYIGTPAFAAFGGFCVLALIDAIIS